MLRRTGAITVAQDVAEIDLGNWLAQTALEEV